MISTIIANAQIPDSLNITLPWSSIIISDCNQSLGEGPYTDNDNIFISESSIQVLEGSDGTCSAISRSWDILSATNGGLYSFSQLAEVDSEEAFEVVKDKVIVYNDLPLSLEVEDLILDIDESHEYSFSFIDVTDRVRSFDTGNIGGNVDLLIYNHTTKSINEVSVYFTVCEEEIVIDVPSSVEMKFDGEPYLFITEELLDFEIVYPCSAYDVSISYNQFNTIYSTQIGSIVEVLLIINPEVGPTYTESINLLITGTPPSPLPMYIEEKTFTAGEEVTLDVWSDGIDQLIAWQLRLNFENAIILSIEAGTTFGEIPHNIFNNDKNINTTWFPWDVVPVDMPSDETWFTLTILPEVDGSTLDIFKTENDPWSAIDVVDGEGFVEYGVDFTFSVAERNVLSNINSSPLNFIIVNNPVGDLLSMDGLQSFDSGSSLTVFSIDGQQIITLGYDQLINSNQIDVSSLPHGLYIVSFISNTKTESLQFVKM